MKPLMHLYTKEEIKLILFFVPTVISTLAIFQGDTTLAPPIVEKTLSLVNWGCFLALLLFCNFKKIWNPIVIVLALMVFLMRSIHVAPGNEVRLSGVLMLLLMIVFSTFKREEIHVLLGWFRKYLVAMSVVGIIISLDFLVGLGLPHETVEYYGLNQAVFYENYHFSYLFVDGDGIRLCGLFNEPGYMGTISALILIVEELNLKRIGNIVIFIAGCFTLSLAFFFLIVVGAFAKAVSDRKAMLKLLSVLCVLIIGIMIFDNNNVVKDFLGEQLEYDKKERKIGGHSREDDSFIKVLNEFNESGPWLLGYGTGYCQKKGVIRTASIRVTFVEWGYLGSAMVYGLLLMAGLIDSKKNKNALIFLMCFMLSIIQRPFVWSTAYFVIFWGGIYHLRNLDYVYKLKSVSKKLI